MSCLSFAGDGLYMRGRFLQADVAEEGFTRCSFPTTWEKDVLLRCEECLGNLNRRDAVSTSFRDSLGFPQENRRLIKREV